jgi:hypothetical protein
MNREYRIENAIMKRPEALGYPGALVIRNARVSRITGRVDLMILPGRGPKKLVLVEAKQVESPDASCKAIGQLIMYYTAALQIGLKGLSKIRRFAESNPTQARSTRNTSLNKLSGGARSQDEGWNMLQEGRKLRPGEIALFLALNGKPKQKLIDNLRLLKRHHRLGIRVVIANKRGVRIYSPI